GVLGQVRVHHLQRAEFFEENVLGLVDDAHPALAQPREDAVLPPDQDAGLPLGSLHGEQYRPIRRTGVVLVRKIRAADRALLHGLPDGPNPTAVVVRCKGTTVALWRMRPWNESTRGISSELFRESSCRHLSDSDCDYLATRDVNVRIRRLCPESC